MKIALAQCAMDSDLESNFLKTLEIMKEAARNEAEIVSFPELQLSPFFPQFKNKDVSEYEVTLDSDYLRRLSNACKDLQLVVIPNFYLKDGKSRYDASPVIDANGTILGVSKMVHVVQAHNFYEQDYYTPSNDGFKVYDTAVGRLGVVICFDRHYPESIRSCVLQGADLIIIPTANTKDEPLEMFEWELRVPAMQNSVFVAMCNRVGVENEMHFCGESIVVDPRGDVVVKAGDQEGIVYADIDLSSARAIRNQKPYMRLRRPNSYHT